MRSNKEYVGEKINDWEIIDWVKGNKGIEWVCRCKCGEIKTHKVDNIKNGRSKMCKKCSAKTRKVEKIPKQEKILKLRYNNHLSWTEDNTFEGTYKEYLEECKKRREIRRKIIEQRKIEINKNKIRDKRIYGIWSKMKERCYNIKDKSYKNYGGRGIEVCDEWKNNSRAFIEWAYNNGYDENAKYGDCTIDRIDVNGNYEPNNCRWVDMKTQSNNKRPKEEKNRA